MRTTKSVHRLRFVVGILLAAGFTGATNSTAAPLFGPSTEYAAGAYPRGVAIADLNGDGKPDLAVPSYTSGAVSVMLGDGAGGFGAPSSFPTDLYPTWVSIGDFDADGNLDLVTTNQGAGRNLSTVSVLLGVGDGSFGPKTDYRTGDFPDQVAIGDLDADGDLDLATANFESLYSTVSVLLGNGDGSFGPKTDFHTGQTPASVAIGDLNADGKPDLVTSNWGYNVSVLLGNGDGSFGTVTNYPSVYGNKKCVALGDFNGDGKLDVGTGTLSGGNALVLLGNGNGSLGTATAFGVGGDPVSVAIGDLDADGDLDQVTANMTNSVSILRGNGDGSFRPRIDHGVGGTPNAVAIGDVNGDGMPDLVTSNRNTNTISVLLNTGPGTLSVGGPTERFELAPPRPNPFRAGAHIGYALPVDSPVSLEVFAVSGQHVRTLVRGNMPAGPHEVAWDGADDRGRRVSAGIYLYRLRASSFEATQRLVMIP